jgi:hypothetical protein
MTIDAVPRSRTSPAARAILLELLPLAGAIATFASLPFGLLVLLVAPPMALVFALSGLGWFSARRPFEGTCMLLGRGALVLAAYVAYFAWLNDPTSCEGGCAVLSDLAAPLLLLAAALPLASAALLWVTLNSE